MTSPLLGDIAPFTPGAHSPAAETCMSDEQHPKRGQYTVKSLACSLSTDVVASHEAGLRPHLRTPMAWSRALPPPQERTEVFPPFEASSVFVSASSSSERDQLSVLLTLQGQHSCIFSRLRGMVSLRKRNPWPGGNGAWRSSPRRSVTEEGYFRLLNAQRAQPSAGEISSSSQMGAVAGILNRSQLSMSEVEAEVAWPGLASTARSLATLIGLLRVATERSPLNSASNRAFTA